MIKRTLPVLIFTILLSFFSTNSGVSQDLFTSLSGCKFNDLNCNGIWEDNEPTIPGWPIIITDPAGNVINTETNDTGCWQVDVPSSDSGILYTIAEGTQPGWDQSYPSTGFYEFTVVPNQPIDGLNFGNCFHPQTTILSGCKFNDLNCNGVWESTEPTIPGWPIFILDVANNTIDTVFTTDNGCWSVEVPAPGEYIVSEGQLSPYWRQTYPVDGFYDLFVDVNQPIDGLNFGNSESHTLVTVCKVNDLNCNGEVDANEPTIPDWPILLQTETPVNGGIVVNIDTFYTNDGGCYSFDFAPGAIYTIIEGSVPGWTSTGIDQIGPFDLTGDAACGTVVVDVLPFLNCMEPPQDTCGLIVDDNLEFDCNENGFMYTYTFYLQNNSPDNITSFLLSDLGSVDVSTDYFSSNNYPGMFPIAPGATAGPFTTVFTLPFPILDPIQGCFTVILITDGDVCCHFEHCVDVPGVDPCENVHVEVTPTDIPDITPTDIQNDCCYEINFLNDFCPNFFTGATLNRLTPGVVFSSYTNASSLWDVTQPALTQLNANYIGGFAGNGHLPLGPSGPFFFCINTDQYGSGPVQIQVTWNTTTPDGNITGVCEEVFEVVCDPPCLEVTGMEEVQCNDGGTFYIPNLCVFNNTTENPTVLLLEPQNPGMVITPDNIAFTGSPTCTGLQISGAASGDIVSIKVILLDEESGWCCHEFIEFTLPDCGSGCDCGSYDSYLADVNQGFELDLNCPDAHFKAVAAGECDKIDWTFTNENGETVTASGGGNDEIVMNLPSGVYTVCMLIQRFDSTGQFCFAGDFVEYCDVITINCPIPCIDPSLITNDPCILIFQPVCGCDGVTYSNSCFAQNTGGVTSWVPGTCNSVPVVIDVTGVQVGNTSYELSWTYQADALIHYLVQRRTDATDWETISAIEPASISSTMFSYADNNPDVGDNYYRVVGLYENGQFALSNEVSGTFTNTIAVDFVYPNPAVSLITVEFGKPGKHQISIFDQTGRLQSESEQTGKKSNLDISTLPEGLYIIRIVNEDGSDSAKRFMKVVD